MCTMVLTPHDYSVRIQSTLLGKSFALSCPISYALFLLYFQPPPRQEQKVHNQIHQFVGDNKCTTHTSMEGQISKAPRYLLDPLFLLVQISPHYPPRPVAFCLSSPALNNLHDLVLGVKNLHDCVPLLLSTRCFTPLQST